ncbi:hypothetical protein Pelo_15875 [Pelomyxa schiedti]|nr:hypothetical protein Pelo_15875 [Pelomyxa schiedti]
MTVPNLEHKRPRNNSGSQRDWLKTFRHHVTMGESLPGNFRQDFQDEGLAKMLPRSTIARGANIHQPLTNSC